MGLCLNKEDGVFWDLFDLFPRTFLSRPKEATHEDVLGRLVGYNR